MARSMLKLFTLIAALVAGAALPALGARLSFADWSMLSPTGTAVPVFLQVLCYGQSVPLVVNRIGGGRPRALRAAILLGSFIPFALSATWAVLTSVLLDPGMPGVMSATSGAFGEGVTNDPLVLLLRGPLEVYGIRLSLSRARDPLRGDEDLRVPRDGEDVLVLRDAPEPVRPRGADVPVDRRLPAEDAECLVELVTQEQVYVVQVDVVGGLLGDHGAPSRRSGG